MEKFFAVFNMGLKYLYRYRRRYGFLFAALIFGFAVVTFITSMKDGMYDSVYYAAQSHYAGDIVAVGYDSYSAGAAGAYHHRMERREISAILNAAGAAEIDPEYTVFRTLYGSYGLVHFNGNAVPLKYLMGCDWENERHIFGKMSFEEPLPLISGDDCIILSVPVARQLDAKVGDSVILEAETRWGQKNTGAFIVKGIVEDASLFGYYKAYVSRLSLNRLVAYNDDDCSSIGFFLDDPSGAGEKRKKLHRALSGEIQVSPLVYDRDEMDRERNVPWDGIKVFLYTLPVYLTEISELLDAMNIITYSLYGMMLLIIWVSAAVTYRLILHERTREMGIMRVIGFYGGDLRLLLWTEIFIIGLVSLAAGFILARIFSWVVSFFSFSWLPGFEIFMKNGKLSAMYLPETTAANVALIFLVLFAVALFPSFRASRKNLPALLSGEPL